MGFLRHLGEKLESDLSFQTLLKIILILIVIWLVKETGGFWQEVFTKVWYISEPFFIGFIIAYVIRWPVQWLSKHHVPRWLGITLMYILFFAFCLWIISSLLPVLSSSTGDLRDAIVNALNSFSTQIAGTSHGRTPGWLSDLIQKGADSLADTDTLLPGITTDFSSMLSKAFSSLITIILAIVISVFMTLGWDNIRSTIVRMTKRISEKFYTGVFAVNDEISSYLRSLLILIVIRFFEYSAVYLLVGHPQWLMMAVCTAIAVVIPYIAPTIVNVIGLLTALALAPSRAVLLLAFIVILSFVDGYVIEPLVHSHNTAVTPLWALFSIFAGSTLAGGWGMMLAIPVYLAIRKILHLYQDDAPGKAGS